MMEPWIHDVLLYPTIVLSCISIICNIIVFFSALKQNSLLIKKVGFVFARTTNDYIFYNLILWLSVFGLFQSVNVFFVYCMDWHHVNVGCIITACWAEFMIETDLLWHFVIVIYFIYLLIFYTNVNITPSNSKTNNNNNHNNNHNNHNNKHSNNHNRISSKSSTSTYQSKGHCSFLSNHFNQIVSLIIFLSLVGAVIPLQWHGSNHYGIRYNYIKNGYNYGAECWFKTNSLFEIIPIATFTIDIILHLFALILCIYKYCQTKWYTTAYVYLIKRLLSWVVVFLIVSIVPIMNRLLPLIFDDSNDNAPLWLVLALYYSEASVGIATGIVWYLSIVVIVPKAKNSKQKLTSMDMDHDHEYIYGDYDPNEREPTSTFRYLLYPSCEHSNSIQHLNVKNPEMT